MLNISLTKKSENRTGGLMEFRYSPGYSDMRGARHEETLRKDPGGRWIITSRDREVWSDPITVTEYETSPEAVGEFENLLRSGKVTALEKCRESDIFATDYSPMEISFCFGDPSQSRLSWESHRIGGYKEYSKAQHKLIRTIIDRFSALHGEKISEKTEEND